MRTSRIILAAVAAAAAAACWPLSAHADELWVDGGPGCSDALTAAEATAPGRAWCTVSRAASLAAPADTVRIRPGVYQERVRFTRSGTADAPIRFVGDGPGVVIDAGGLAQALLLRSISDVEVSGLRVTGGANEGAWVEGGARVRFADVEATGNPGAGVRLKAAADFTLADSLVADNGSAGVMELIGTVRARYTGNTIRANGGAAAAYNGDGIQLGGTDAVVAGNEVSGNGSGQWEHGIYTGARSSGWIIEGNRIAANAGANVKAAGGPGLLRRNWITGGRFGLILTDNPVAVDVQVNVLDGRAQHLVVLSTGVAPARARLWANTVVQAGRSTASGDASAVFVIAADSLELRNNLLCYQGADALGSSVMVNDPTRLGSLVSETNWFCAREAQSRHLGWAGSRTTLASWRSVTGQDARSLTSWAPLFDAQARVTSTNWGRDRGDVLPLAADFGGFPMPPAGLVDIGAWQT